MAERRELNVRELLELERQIYQESIDRVLHQQEQLSTGVLEDFVRRCTPFEVDRNCELKVAQTQLEFSQQDALDLLAFDLQQAEDVYRARRQQLKCNLLADTHRRRAKVKQRLKALDEKLITKSNVKVEANNESEDCVVLEKGVLQPKVLEKQLLRAQKRTRKYFNFRHLSGGVLPTPEMIVSDVMEECTKLQRNRERERMARRALRDGVASSEITLIEDGQKLRCRLDEKRGAIVDETFSVGDAVVLKSQLTEEDFYGFVSDLTSDEVKLMLVCGTHVRVAIARLRTGQCILRKRPKVDVSLDIRNGQEDHYHAPALSGVATSLQELLRNPPDVRRRAAAVLNRLKRKTSIDIRRGF